MIYAAYFSSIGTTERPVLKILSGPDTAHLTLNTFTDETYTVIDDLYDPLLYKGVWNGTSFDFVERTAITTLGSWNATTIVANGSSTATFSSGLPNPTEVEIIVPVGLGLVNPARFNETSGSFSLNTTVPGTYEVIFRAFPYKELVTFIEATA